MDELKQQHNKENAHYYTRVGKQVETVMGKNGFRPVNVRDCAKLKLVPGTTTVLKVATNFLLDNWKQEQTIKAAWCTPRKEGESEKEHILRIKEKAGEIGRNSSARGKLIHAIVQAGFCGGVVTSEYYYNARDVVLAECGDVEWMCEESFAIKKYGGKVDLEANDFILDIKTTEHDLEIVSPWESYVMQLAAYNRGRGKKCGILYINANTGECKIHWLTPEEISKGMDMFKGLLSYWYAKNIKYRKKEKAKKVIKKAKKKTKKVIAKKIKQTDIFELMENKNEKSV